MTFPRSLDTALRLRGWEAKDDPLTFHEDNMHSIIGRTVKDRITGFKGVVTGRVEYITGCNQLLVTPIANAEGNKRADSVWLDDIRCQILTDVEKVRLQDDTTDTSMTKGFGEPAPIR